MAPPMVDWSLQRHGAELTLCISAIGVCHKDLVEPEFMHCDPARQHGYHIRYTKFASN